MEEGNVKKIMKRAEIDTRAPFRSVKEAVSLFGEKVFGGEVYANKLKEIHDGASKQEEYNPSKLGMVKAELEETRQSLQKAKEERILMENTLSSLKQELERTKQQLQQVKQTETTKTQLNDSDIEDVKIIKDSTEFELKLPTNINDQEETTFQKKKYVTFANPPSVTQVTTIPQGLEVLERHPSLRKPKNKPLLPFLGGIFSKRKGRREVAAP